MAKFQLGSPLPPGDPHAVSVCLPTWQNTIDWAQRDESLLEKLQTGYPRFFVPLVVRELAEKLVRLSATPRAKIDTDESTAPAVQDRLALVFPREGLARACQKYLDSRDLGSTDLICATFSGDISASTKNHDAEESLFAVAYPPALAAEAKAFWQHTGYGISSRCATFWLENAPLFNHDNRNINGATLATPLLPLAEAERARSTLRRRIGGLYDMSDAEVAENSVFLYPSGMSAISHTATMLQAMRRPSNGAYRVAIFGFLYVDTFKVLSNIHQFEPVLYGHATAPASLESLESELDSGRLVLDALYTEFPGNPLLGSVDLSRLHSLARRHDFLLIVDDTVATSANVRLLEDCDLVCTSLTKMFSGGCNVMGGSVALNPAARHYDAARRALRYQHVDTDYFAQDVLVMECNSRDFAPRVAAASANTSAVAAMLRGRTDTGTGTGTDNPAAVVQHVYYPQGSATQHLYDAYRRRREEGAAAAAAAAAATEGGEGDGEGEGGGAVEEEGEGGYGYLLSATFATPAAAVAFHDALDVAKGPSLGTNFTLACAYTLFAHYGEREWAAGFGVVEHLVRISVGIEETGYLMGVVGRALDAAEGALMGMKGGEEEEYGGGGGGGV